MKIRIDWLISSDRFSPCFLKVLLVFISFMIGTRAYSLIEQDVSEEDASNGFCCTFKYIVIGYIEENFPLLHSEDNTEMRKRICFKRTFCEIKRSCK